jgi:hypothetical protein
VTGKAYWRRLGRELVTLAVMAALFAAVYAVGELIVYGRVR